MLQLRLKSGFQDTKDRHRLFDRCALPVRAAGTAGTRRTCRQNRLDGQDWSGISAVKNRRVYKVPAGLYRWAPPNSFEKPLYMKWTAAIVQPKLFSDIDIRKEIRDFYASYYKYNLTEEQIDTILGLMAGASTPAWIIEDVVQTLCRRFGCESRSNE